MAVCNGNYGHYKTHTCKECHKTESFEITPLQTKGKKNNWKTEEALARAAVTLEMERIKGSNVYDDDDKTHTHEVSLIWLNNILFVARRKSEVFF